MPWISVEEFFSRRLRENPKKNLVPLAAVVEMNYPGISFDPDKIPGLIDDFQRAREIAKLPGWYDDQAVWGAIRCLVDQLADKAPEKASGLTIKVMEEHQRRIEG
ncbi:MAG: hypothetical protein PHQ47_01295 [Candidatus Portnoybacteria bacterium]|nr:hypothetical protein [Candidatus Portnoybacteria bacterium]